MLQLTVNTPAPTSFVANQNIVPLERVILDDKMLLVSSPATNWVNHNRVTVNAKGLLERYKRLVKAAKAAGAKVVYKNGTKKCITEIQNDAVAAEAYYEQLYQQLKAGWRKKVETGIVSPSCDDAELKSLYEISRLMTELLYRNKPLGRAMTIAHSLKQIETRITEGDGRAEGVTFYL